MRAPTFAFVLWLLLATIAGAEPRNLVRNPGFEVGDPIPADWPIHEDVDEDSAGTTQRDTQVFHAGAASLRLSLPGGHPDVQSVVQTWEVGGAHRELRGQPLFFTAWLKSRDAGVALVWLEFIDAKGFQISIQNLSPTRPITGTSEWGELGRVVTVPEDAQTMALGISLYYRGDLWIDDVGLVLGLGDAETAAAVARTTPPADDRTVALLSELQGAVFATALGAAADGESEVLLSAPFPFAGQAPIAFRVGSIPADRIHHVKIARAPHEDAIAIGLKSLSPGETVRLFWQALVVATDRPLDPRALVQARIGAPDSYPEAVRRWLGSEPGVEVEAPIVQGSAERLKTYQGYTLDFLQGMNAAIQSRLSLREGGPGPHGADHVLSQKKGAELGYANAVAAVARAGNVPARLLVAAPWGQMTAEAYFVEFHLAGVGWVRCDPVSGSVPIHEYDMVVIHVIAPDEPRLPDATPVPVRARGPLRAGPIQGALRQAAALRSDRVEGRGGLSHAHAAALLAPARTRWEEAAKGALGTEAKLLATADLSAEVVAALAGMQMADPDALVAASWKRHAAWLDSLSMGWGQSLVRNPGFEEENRGRPTGWHLPTGKRIEAEIAVAAGGALRGERALHAQLKEIRNRYEVVSQRVSRFPVGLPLVLSVYAKGTCDGDAILSATYLDDRRNPLDKPRTARTKLDGGEAWKRLSLDLEAPRLASMIQVEMLTEGAGDLWLDEFDLRAGGGFPAYPGEELLVNSGFEDAGYDALPAAWRAERTGATADTLDLAQEVSGHGSKWAAYTAATVESAEAAFVQLVRHVPATGRVRLTGWVRTDRLSGGAALSLAFRRTPFEETVEPSLRVTSEGTQPVRSTAAWTQVTLEADVPPDTLSIEVRAAAKGSGKSWWDDVSVQAVERK